MLAHTSSKISTLLTFSLVFVAMSFAAILSAQECTPADITLSNQAEIDNFQANHGPCNRVQGNLLIGHYGDTVNLNGLSGLATVEGNLSIQNNFELTDVSALGGLTGVGGTLHFYGNVKLSNLNGMSNLTQVGKGLKLEWNDSLIDFSALHGLNQVGQSEWGGSISIFNNVSLTNVDGLIGLNSISGGMEIGGNNALTHLGGLSNLTQIGGYLNLTSNDSLNDISGLGNLTAIGGDLWITGHDALTDLAHLLKLSRVGGNIEITFNNSLRRINGLDNLGQVGGWFYINHNQALESVNLSSLHYVPYCFEIRDNPALASLDGLSNLNQVSGCLWINGNGSLARVTGLSKLRSVGGSFELRNNGALISLDGLDNLVSVGSIQVQANSSLSNCSALSRLLDPVDDPPFGPGAPLSAIPDVAGSTIINNNHLGCNSRIEIMASTPVHQINSGMNDAWFNPETDGQGFLIVVYPAIQQVFLSWYTYDIERPPADVHAFLGDPGHRWLTALGEYVDNQGILDIWVAEGGVFDSPYPEPVLEPDGEILLEFDTCNSGTVTYHIPSVEKQGTIPIERIALDNAMYCAGLNPRQLID